MKKSFKLAIIAAFLVLSPLAMLAQPHPNGGLSPTISTNVPVGGGAPVGDGLVILLVMGAAYGAGKFYLNRKITSVPE